MSTRIAEVKVTPITHARNAWGELSVVHYEEDGTPNEQLQFNLRVDSVSLAFYVPLAECEKLAAFLLERASGQLSFDEVAGV